MSFVPCISWVKRGVAAAQPTVVKLDRDQLDLLIKDGEARNETSESEMETNGAKPEKPFSGGLRGSAPRHETIDEGEGEESEGDHAGDAGEEESPADPYKMEDYDNEEVSKDKAKSDLGNLAVFATEEDDPYITKHGDLDSDGEDFIVKPMDNLLVAGKAQKDEFNLEVHVYNEEEVSFYCHHDYCLSAPPLCIEPIGYDPGEGSKGNLCAIGGMLPIIEIWDLDMVETLEPVAVLGLKKKKKKLKNKNKKNGRGETSSAAAAAGSSDDSKMCHSEAILDLAWNARMDHILASGSADYSVILWDLDKAQGATKIQAHQEKVQSLKWHPVEPEILLTGSCDKTVKLWDGRDTATAKTSLAVDGEVERVTWNPHDPYYFLCSTDVGSVFVVDTRNPVALAHKAHEEAVTVLEMSPMVDKCVLTASADKKMRLWTLADDQTLQLVTEEDFEIGRIHCGAFCPENGWLVALGGENKDDSIKLWDIRNSSRVTDVFSTNEIDSSAADENNMS